MDQSRGCVVRLESKLIVIRFVYKVISPARKPFIRWSSSDYISKPFNPVQLIEKINYWKNSTHTSLVQNNVQAPDFPSSNTDQNTLNETTSAPIEFDALYHRLMDDKELALSLLKKMDARLEDNLAEIKLALESQNAEQVKQLVHKLKGSAGNLSAEPLRRALGNLELVLMENNWNAVAEELNEVIARVDEFHNAVVDLK